MHTFIDRLLHDEIGAAASKLHTGRSRNDQVATATRMWTMDAASRLDSAVRGLQSVILEKAKTLEGVVMPSYTHLQRAIPVSGAHWLLSHFWPLDRDRARLRATRMWTMDASSRLDGAVRGLQSVILEKAKGLEGVVMPSYTHLQRAIPVSAAHWILSHFWPLDRDRARLRATRQSAAVLPLGSGAVAGSAYPVSRTLLQGTLGFEAISPNSVDAVSDRDFIAEMLFASTMIATHLSRLGEDLVIYGSSEFGFVQFGDRYTSGSSMMPQKRNPDALELARGSAARMLGNLMSLLATLKGLPSSYNKDLQDDKRPLFDAVDTLLLVLPAVAGALAECAFQPERMKAACASSMMATDVADYLVRKGASFREAHGAVGSLIRASETSGQELSALPFATFQKAHALFEKDVTEALSPTASLLQREIPGGTGPNAVSAQIEKARASLVVVAEQRPNQPQLASLYVLVRRATVGVTRTVPPSGGALTRFEPRANCRARLSLRAIALRRDRPRHSAGPAGALSDCLEA